MRLIIRTLVILGGVFFLQTVLPTFVEIQPQLLLVLACGFAAAVPEMEKRAD